jgi:histidyl-tRNA synthetase
MANVAALAIARLLVERGISAQTEVTDRSLKAGFKWAGKIGAQAAVILGENEIAEGTAIVRDLKRGEQETVALEEVPGYVAGLIDSDQQT